MWLHDAQMHLWALCGCRVDKSVITHECSHESANELVSVHENTSEPKHDFLSAICILLVDGNL